MFWLLLTKRGILLGKLHLSKSPAVILTNEPWKSEEVCVYVCAAMHLCLWIHACVLLLEHKHTNHKDDTQMADVHAFFAFFKAAGLSFLD